MRSTTIVASIIAFSVAAVQAAAPEHTTTAVHSTTAEHKPVATHETKSEIQCNTNCTLTVGKEVFEHFTMTPGQYYAESQGLYCNKTDPKHSDFMDKLDVCLKKCPKDEQSLPKDACESYSKTESGAHSVEDTKTTDSHSSEATPTASKSDDSSKSHDSTSATASKDDDKATHSPKSAAPIVGVSTVLATLCGVVALFAL
ncbi:hypothetical protein K7432_011232 [Basidiobolus ranarum]|uniref:Uncharacterized protein n=1 Tax=Basidiobolus ranarum TaxID=34480 RepID=A0ABR2VU87_9FUNG